MVKKIGSGKKNIYIILTFLFLLLYSLYNFLFLCKFFPQDTFDSQLAIFWDYTAIHGFFPNLDVMYPYGFLFYYKNISLFFSIIYIFLFPALGTLALITFKKIIKKTIYIYVSFLLFIFFILRYTGIEAFNRYGLLFGISILLSFICNRYLYIPKLHSFLLGCLIGFIASIINDVGLYIISVFLFFSFFVPIFNKGLNILKTKRYYVYQFLTLVFFSIGVLIGILPIIVFFIKLENVQALFSNLKYLVDFPLYSKTPFLPSLRSSESVFSFVAVIITISLLSYKRIILREKNTYLSYIRIGIVFSVFLLLQKSVIRSMDIQITFFGIILYMFLIFEIVNFLKTKMNHKLQFGYYLLCIFVLVYMFNLRNFDVTSIYSYRLLKHNLFTLDFKSLLMDRQKKCFFLSLDVYRNNKTYKSVLSTINHDAQGEKPFTFDYFTNPIFYILFSDRFPFYFEVFGSSPLYAQQSNVKYIENNLVKYVIYNTDALRFKDNVPDYLRGWFLFKYIIKNFRVLKKIDNFIVFKKTEISDYDFFNDNNLINIPGFKNYLLDIDLGAIPNSEGIYKSKLLKNSKKVNIKFPFNSRNKALLITTKDTARNKKMKVTIISDSYTTNVEFNSCGRNNFCIVNLANVPLFYRDRLIKKINYALDTINSIKILDGIPNGIF